MLPLQVAGSGAHQPLPHRQSLKLMSASLWTQSRLFDPLYQWKVVTSQVGIGHPSGGVIERGCRMAVDEAARATRVAIVGKINMLGIPECSPQKSKLMSLTGKSGLFLSLQGAFISLHSGIDRILSASYLEER